MKVSIVIPAYNEERRIGKTLDEYSIFFEKIRKNKKKFDYEVLIVINNTKDNTEEVVKKYKKKNKRIIYLNFKQGGKGFAITEGFKDALKRKNEFIGFTDADMATSPEEFYKLIESIKDRDGAIADRYKKGSKITPKYSFRRLIVSRVFNYLVRGMFMMNYRDTQCGGKLFRREVIEKILPELKLSSWAYDVNLLYSCKQNGYRIVPIATSWVEKSGSKLNVLKTSIEMFLSVIQLRLVRSPFKRLLRPFKSIIHRIWKVMK